MVGEVLALLKMKLLHDTITDTLQKGLHGCV